MRCAPATRKTLFKYLQNIVYKELIRELFMLVIRKISSAEDDNLETEWLTATELRFYWIWRRPSRTHVWESPTCSAILSMFLSAVVPLLQLRHGRPTVAATVPITLDLPVVVETAAGWRWAESHSAHAHTSLPAVVVALWANMLRCSLCVPRKFVCEWVTLLDVYLQRL
jgi:hypothetical protein